MRRYITRHWFRNNILIEYAMEYAHFGIAHTTSDCSHWSLHMEEEVHGDEGRTFDTASARKHIMRIHMSIIVVSDF